MNNTPAGLSQWNVVLLADSDHTDEYVVALLRSIFWMNEAKAAAVLSELATEGRSTLYTTHLEHAEYKREQVYCFAKDTLLDGPAGAMQVALEAADNAVKAANDRAAA